MDNEVRLALEKLAETVNTEGWQIISKDLEKKIELIKEELTVADQAVNGDLLRIAQGRILAYRDIMSIPLTVQHALNQVEDVEDE